MVAIQEGPSTKGQKGIRTEWPVEEGLIAGTTRQVGVRSLHPTGVNGESTNILSRNRKLL